MAAPLKVHGADLSHHNATPDLKRAKAAGLLWLYHKVTEGAGFVDSTYGARRRLAKEAGVPFGAYHFARPDAGGGDAKLEAQRFMKLARPVAGDLSPALDFEVEFGGAEAWCKTFMNEVARLLRLRNLSATLVHYGPDDFGADYPYIRWVPRYNLDNRKPEVRYDIFQFSGGAPYPGTPSTFAGLGAVDLNNMKDKLSLSDFRVKAERTPTPTPLPVPETRRVKVGHISLEFSDTDEQQSLDVNKIFSRAVNKDWAWFTGTEAGSGKSDLRTLLREAAEENNFKFFIPENRTDSWICVNEKYIKRGSYSTNYEPVIPGSGELKGSERDWAPKGVVSVAFETPDSIGIGPVSVGASHYLTGGRKVNETHGEVNHWAWNNLLGDRIGEWAVQASEGAGLAFYGGDQNMNDASNNEPQGDTFFGAPLTSAWDELGRWESTGHGCIDVIASCDRDNRVEAVSVQALDDSEFHLHADHYLVEAVYEIRLLS